MPSWSPTDSRQVKQFKFQGASTPLNQGHNMGKIKIQLVEDEETPSTWEKIWNGFLELMTLVGMVATVAFIAGYVVAIQPSSVVQCEPTKTVLTKSIFK